MVFPSIVVQPSSLTSLTFDQPCPELDPNLPIISLDNVLYYTIRVTVPPAAELARTPTGNRKDSSTLMTVAEGGINSFQTEQYLTMASDSTSKSFGTLEQVPVLSRIVSGLDPSTSISVFDSAAQTASLLLGQLLFVSGKPSRSALRENVLQSTFGVQKSISSEINYTNRTFNKSDNNANALVVSFGMSLYSASNVYSVHPSRIIDCYSYMFGLERFLNQPEDTTLPDDVIDKVRCKLSSEIPTNILVSGLDLLAIKAGFPTVIRVVQDLTFLTSGTLNRVIFHANKDTLILDKFISPSRISLQDFLKSSVQTSIIVSHPKDHGIISMAGAPTSILNEEFQPEDSNPLLLVICDVLHKRRSGKVVEETVGVKITIDNNNDSSIPNKQTGPSKYSVNYVPLEELYRLDIERERLIKQKVNELKKKKKALSKQKKLINKDSKSSKNIPLAKPDILSNTNTNAKDKSNSSDSALKAIEKKPDPTENLTFNLKLTKEQEESRAKVDLPYIKKQEEQRTPTSSKPQSSDENSSSEEDPDDDLDI